MAAALNKLITCNFYASFNLNHLSIVCSIAVNSSIGINSLKFLNSLELTKLVDLDCDRACGVLVLWGVIRGEKLTTLIKYQAGKRHRL